MKTIFLIEVDPITKEYFKDVNCGYINNSHSIKDSKQFKTYQEASEQLTNIVISNYDSEKTLYLSIVKFIVKD